MNDAGILIDEQKARIEELEGQIRKMSRELARSSQREYNE
jgi:Spy/CpxP family protein refolding chaperone